MGSRRPQRGAPGVGFFDPKDRRPVIDLHKAAAFALSDIVVDPAVPFQVLWNSESTPRRRGGPSARGAREKPVR